MSEEPRKSSSPSIYIIDMKNSRGGDGHGIEWFPYIAFAMTFVLILALVLALTLRHTSAAAAAVPHRHDNNKHGHLKALVYRGPASCDGCPEAVANLLTSSPENIRVAYVGPKEKTKLTRDALSKVDIYAQPGGGDLDEAWPHLHSSKSTIRKFVQNGGRYIGFCLGAYLAGHGPGFDLLHPKDDTDQEVKQPDSQVKDEEKDTIIQVDWDFSNGTKAKGRWMYFQDGAVIELEHGSKAKVLGRYSSNGNPAATLNKFGKGWVGVIGPHPEADQSWYDSYGISNPDGIHFDIGYDFLGTVVNAGR
ncbi:Hypothetical predicted protein [Lecanosticta acicola]|uniref:Biotin-protein ligase N-terminal domain-containing protein n=1 Tax=Lecanosticta acicola TaxID=111012 RepID=A0AAI9EEG2_9PEZI|nr:Hypothetical predicted protein [Lecanosticta acicola]